MEELNILTIEDTLELNSDMESYFNEDSYISFWNSIKNYPILTSEENKILAIEAQNGNKESRDKLIKYNLRLVAWVANKYKNRINHLQILDIIQEGTIGLMKSIETFDPKKGSFTTNAVNWIRQAISRSISNSDNDIRLPVYLENKRNKYLKIIEDCKEKKQNIPSDEILCEMLEVSPETLINIKNYNYNTFSINQKVKEDDSDTELENFVKVEDNNFEDLLDRLNDERLFAILKEILNHKQYYVIYFRLLSSERKTYTEISKILGISKQGVRQIEESALKKIKPYMIPESKICYNKVNRMKEMGKFLECYNINPININNIILFLYIKEELTDLERQIMYYNVFGKMKIDWYRVKLNLSIKEFDEIKKVITEKTNKALANKTKFYNFKNSILKNNGGKIFDYQLEGTKILDYEHLKNTYDDLDYDDIIDVLNKNGIVINEKDNEVLKKYFKKPQRRNISRAYIEKEIYLLSFNHKNKGSRLPIKKLYKTFIKNIQEFDEEQRLVLECYYFNTKSRHIFLEKYPDSLLYRYFSFLVDKLEKMYYGLNDMFENSFNKEKYIFVKENYPKKLTDERIKLLDMFYGVNSRDYSIKEIAAIINEDYIKVHDKISNARNYCISLYSKRTSSLNIDLSIYNDYICSKKVDLTEETREILKLYIIDGLDYSKINEMTGLSKYRISNIVTEGIRKLDLYRYKIFNVEIISSEDLANFFEMYDRNFNDLERKIIYLKRVEMFDNDKISELLKTSKKEVNSVVSRFNRLYLKYQIRDVFLNKDDIKAEINCHISESVIDDFSKEILSFYYGIGNIFNKEGLYLNSEEIKKKYNLTKDQFYKKFYCALDLIKAKKIGVLKNDLVYIERKELELILNDFHLPISEKEREIICYLFGLHSFPYKTIDELSNMYGDTKSSIKRRYQRAILNILKYKNKEIDGIINYEIDIEPILKYFSKSDVLLIEDYYKNNLTYKELSEKYAFTFDQIVNTFIRIKNVLFDHINDGKNNGFDFEFYRKEKNNPNLPFYGDRKLCNTVFELFVGECSLRKLSIPEIIKELKIENSTTTINSMVSNFMISFCKLKEGITKSGFSYEEIQNYFDINNINMSEEHKQIYLNYFKRKNNKKIVNETVSNASELITYDLLKNYYPNFFSIETTTKEEIYTILKKYYHKMNDCTKEYLMHEFNINYRNFMNGKEINHVFKILATLDNALTKNEKNHIKLSRQKPLIKF